MLHGSCLKSNVIAGKIQGMMKVTVRLRGRLTQILNVLRKGRDLGN